MIANHEQLITVIFFFIETRGATLEEISRTFDGAEAVDEVKELALEVEKVEQFEDHKGTGGVQHVEEQNPEHSEL